MVKMIKIVRMPAPALSEVVIFFVAAVGSLPLVDWPPAPGSDLDLPPLAAVSGAMAGVIKLVPMMDNADIWWHD